MFIEKIRHVITEKCAFLIFFMTSLATIVRPLLIQQDVLFTYVGIVNSVAMGSVFFYLKYTTPKSWHPLLFVNVGILVLAPITFVSGGINSQFAYLFPIIPIFIALVSNAKYTWLTGLTVITVVIGLFLSVGVFPDYTFENVPQAKTKSRAVWLCLAVLMATKLGVEFNRIYGALGDQISKQAETDLLTGLNNRRSVMSFVQTAIDQAKQENSAMSVMMIDLDHFKTINDSHGHLAGDLCLKQVAQLIKQNVRNNSDLAGRFGGEEFIVVIKDIDKQTAHDIANNIRLSIEQASINLNNNLKLKVTATIGICVLKGEQLSSVEHCVDLADKALYQGKKEGRNRIVMS
ncbi:GGDEF domain-containing protein [Paraglaciecola arctica]|uniref:GGDEF domain-containing protein n=1 Tax=Paraglaciecola arctica TaxID=1128911 RepID=UPI001C07425D|nr:GGDEF domain-containing protein [Paraglaciecola arctica]